MEPLPSKIELQKLFKDCYIVFHKRLREISDLDTEFTKGDEAALEVIFGALINARRFMTSLKDDCK
jgi:hypothetical protein